MSPPLWNLTLLTHAVHCSVSASGSILSLSSDSARQLHLHIACACSIGQKGTFLKLFLSLLGTHLNLSVDISAWLHWCHGKKTPNLTRQKAKPGTENIFDHELQKKYLNTKNFFWKCLTNMKVIYPVKIPFLSSGNNRLLWKSRVQQGSGYTQYLSALSALSLSQPSVH